MATIVATNGERRSIAVRRGLRILGLHRVRVNLAGAYQLGRLSAAGRHGFNLILVERNCPSVRLECGPRCGKAHTQSTNCRDSIYHFFLP